LAVTLSTPRWLRLSSALTSIVIDSGRDGSGAHVTEFCQIFRLTFAAKRAVDDPKLFVFYLAADLR
jgi:hypothetical protein